MKGLCLKVGDHVNLGEFEPATQHIIDRWKAEFFDPLGLKRKRPGQKGVNIWECPMCEEIAEVIGLPATLICQTCGLVLDRETVNEGALGYWMIVRKLGQLSRLQILVEEEF